MKTQYALLFSALALLGGCKSKTQTVDAASQAAAASRPGHIVLSPDSLKLKQLRVETVATADVPVNEVVAPGKIEVNPNRVAHVVLPLAGRVVSVLVKLGDAVKQGDPLLWMVSPDAAAAVSGYLQAQAAITQARSGVLKAQADLDRARDLYEHRAIAQKEVLNTETALTQSKAGLEQSQAMAQQALQRLDLLGLKPGDFGQKLAVRAPISGKVLELNVAPGEYRNDLNAGVLTIADLSSVWVAADVPESDIRFIQPGERLNIELTAYPGETFRGKVTRIADTLDPQTRTIKVRAEMENPHERLRPEMFGQIRHVEGTERLPVVPVGAVVQEEGRSIVYKETSPGTFDVTPVTLGARIGDRVAIREGLSPGDRVVTSGVMLLQAS